MRNMLLTKQIAKQQRAIVEHFSATVPIVNRARFEAKLRSALKQQHDDGYQLERLILVCIKSIEEMQKEMT